MKEQFQTLTADIIAHTAFDSSYVQGKESYKAQKELQKCCVALSTHILSLAASNCPTQIILLSQMLILLNFATSLRQVISLFFSLFI
jgi:hypothetical protein